MMMDRFGDCFGRHQDLAAPERETRSGTRRLRVRWLGFLGGVPLVVQRLGEASSKAIGQNRRDHLEARNES
jgi:hypothetical protein